MDKEDFITKYHNERLKEIEQDIAEDLNTNMLVCLGMMINEKGITLSEREMIMSSSNYEEYEHMFKNSNEHLHANKKNKAEYEFLKEVILQEI